MKSVLMCPPTHFDVTGRRNAHMNPRAAAGRPNKALAETQWEELARVYESLGIEVLLINPAKGLEDMVFTANGAYIEKNTVVVSKFQRSMRRPETPLYVKWFKKHGFATHIATHVFEGSGEARPWSDKIIMGYGQRSVISASKKLEQVFNRHVIPFLLIDENFYHLDTALLIIDNDTAIVYPGAFSASGMDVLETLFPNLYTISKKEALALGLNAVVVNKKHIIVSSVAEKVIGITESLGFTVHPLNLSEFKKSGGGPFCLTLPLA